MTYLVPGPILIQVFELTSQASSLPPNKLTFNWSIFPGALGLLTLILGLNEPRFTTAYTLPQKKYNLQKCALFWGKSHTNQNLFDRISVWLQKITLLFTSLTLLKPFEFRQKLLMAFYNVSTSNLYLNSNVYSTCKYLWNFVGESISALLIENSCET